jgi:hypothetical protein
MAITFKVAAQRGFTAHSTSLEFFGNVLKHLDVRYDTP